jgi:hypothetical protein
MTTLQRVLFVLTIAIWFTAGLALGVVLTWTEPDRGYRITVTAKVEA